jgi:hypothetical protein
MPEPKARRLIRPLMLFDERRRAEFTVAIHADSMKWHSLAESYKEAGDLISRAMKTPDALAMYAAPMMFMYRHYVELKLKALLRDAGQLLEDPQDIPNKHTLGTLWSRVVGLLKRLPPGVDDEMFARAAKVVRDLEDVDAASFAFRYPVDNADRPILNNPVLVDPAVVRFVIEDLHYLLDGASGCVEIAGWLKTLPEK